jgi:hypothetical protein
LAVTISIPADWQPTPDLGAGRFGYDGASGWVQLNAMVEPSGLRTPDIGIKVMQGWA